jgi:uncharacterized protein YjbI with pentapeptide repeats
LDFMTNEEQLKILSQGVNAWNAWRKGNPEKKVDLTEADLSVLDLHGINFNKANLSDVNLYRTDLRKANISSADLCGADLRETDLRWLDLSGTNLRWANLIRADLYQANLSLSDIGNAQLYEANLYHANLVKARLCGADLRTACLNAADLRGANLSGANLCKADLRGADLTFANLIEANLERSDLTGCRIFGISAWEVKLKGAIQKDLIITRRSQPIITVDNLEAAQFIYLLLYNEKIRHVIETITSKVVLILGRFTSERKAILDNIRDELREHDYLPVLFDFDGPASRDTRETVSTLAHMARFIIADITDARSIPAELESIVSQLPSVPVQPLILSSDYEYGLFEHIRRFPWVLEPCRYENQRDLLSSLQEKVIALAEAKVIELGKQSR